MKNEIEKKELGTNIIIINFKPYIKKSWIELKANLLVLINKLKWLSVGHCQRYHRNCASIIGLALLASNLLALLWKLSGLNCIYFVILSSISTDHLVYSYVHFHSLDSSFGSAAAAAGVLVAAVAVWKLAHAAWWWASSGRLFRIIKSLQHSGIWRGFGEQEVVLENAVSVSSTVFSWPVVL